MTTVKFKHPITVEGRRIDEVRLRRPTMGDMKAIRRAGDKVDETCMLITLIGELSPAEVDALDVSDFEAVSEAIALFFPKSSTRTSTR